MIYPWQIAQWRHCLSDMQQDRMPHAILLTGVKGLGQVEFAIQLAKQLLCEQPLDEPCGQCRQCHLMTGGHHPDYLEVAPEDVGKPIKVDQIRQLISWSSQTPQLAQQQVVVLHPAEAMNEKAANALLKTLEEPMGQVTFILICHQLASTPITIVSRCQQLAFGCRGEEQQAADSWLRTMTDHHPQVDVAFKLALGAPLLAQTFLKEDVVSLRDGLLKQLLAISPRGFLLGDCAVLAKQPIHRVLYLLRLLYQDVIQAQLGVDVSHWVNADQVDNINQLASRFSIDDCQQQLDQLAQLERANRAHIALNWQLAFEALFVSQLASAS